MTNNNLTFNPGLEIVPTFSPLGFKYGKDVFGPQVENRMLDDLTSSLKKHKFHNCLANIVLYLCVT